jgi:hypothetical protein
MVIRELKRKREKDKKKKDKRILGKIEGEKRSRTEKRREVEKVFT